ncbi:J domain-containing protein [Ramlibacter ginsenosidimutans]|uniref:J domain-containing protein n=1 Tax=Ramlibacter ginsenosidimutans TaxID=502333 RepID=A0A934WMX1_9BURK|nr:J domain-containing protein [Ramlibacter ginsenosidimutans]MBK6007086.1 J domain-containing protein [Ramlibacter ginsenosidimutans]
MAQAQLLQIEPDPADASLARQQEHFNALVQEVAAGRATLAEWKDRIARYHQAVEPLQRELHAAWREWALALDQASLRPGLSRGERQQLSELLRDAVAPLLEHEDDIELAAVAERHGDAVSSARAGADDIAPASSDATHLENIAEEWERQAASAAAQRAQRAAKRRAASASKQRAKEERDASQSVRDVYRRVASALHPDREPDAAQRARKTSLMQQANEAYGQRNLLALLELQLQAEQVDAAHLSSANRQRLQHYITVLQEQLADLQSETRRMESSFREATGAAPGSGLQPRKADRLISSEAQRLRADLLSLRRQTRALQDVEDLKAWLRAVRKG